MSVDTVRYAYQELSENYDDSWWWRKRIAARINGPVQRTFFPRERKGVSVMSEDWDTLVVLDACRTDLFESIVSQDQFDSYRRTVSRGSATAEWTSQNFADGEFGDTVYVASNPHTSKLAGDSFYELVEVWRDSFDDERRTVMPGPITEAAIAAHERSPDKRLIVHYMQPHRPFVNSDHLQFGGWHPKWHYEEKEVDGYAHPFHALEAGAVSLEDVWEAYGDNLELVIDDVFELVSAIPGRTVITSDHGNLVGERSWPVPIRQYAHPRGLRKKELVEVPWAVIERGDRRSITTEGVRSAEPADQEELSSRLRDLGYVE